MATKNPHKTENWPWLRSYPAAVSWDAPIEPSPVYGMLYDTAAKFGAAPGFDFLGKKYKWGAIADYVDRFAAGLQKENIGKGTRVGLFLPNSPYFLIAYYAVLRTGATVVNYNPLYVKRELEHQIEDSATDYLVTADLALLCDKALPLLHSTRLKKLILCRFTDILPFPKNILFRRLKGKDLAAVPEEERCVWFHDLVDHADKPKPVEIDPHKDVALLQYTGGTTGKPKGAMLSHYNIVANAHQAANWFHEARPGEEKMLGVLPFFHVFAMTAVMNMSVLKAFEIIALPRFDLEETLKIIDKKKPQYFPAVPAIYSAINNYAKRDRYDLGSLRYCISGGAPLPVEVKKSFENKTGCIVVEGYGLTEASPVVCVNPIVGLNKPGSIGLPVPGTIVRLVDQESPDRPVPQGKKGELCVKGPQVMLGYLNCPEESRKVLKDGWLHTGDIACMDEEGYFYIVDRLKDMIITNGYNVYPRNIEEAIYTHPEVEECVVAGIPEPARGEVVKAWIKPKEGRDISVADMKAFLEDKLSPMERPRRYEFRKEPLPKTMIGKLSRKDLLAEEAEKATRKKKAKKS